MMKNYLRDFIKFVISEGEVVDLDAYRREKEQEALPDIEDLFTSREHMEISRRRDDDEDWLYQADEEFEKFLKSDPGEVVDFSDY